jgi:hypothetical protein
VSTYNDIFYQRGEYRPSTKEHLPDCSGAFLPFYADSNSRIGYATTTALGLRCSVCREYASLGAANDASEEVQIEVRAAELAADKHAKMSMCESFGWESWLAPKFSTDPADANYASKWHAGYLARCIATHPDPSGGES